MLKNVKDVSINNTTTTTTYSSVHHYFFYKCLYIKYIYLTLYATPSSPNIDAVFKNKLIILQIIST